MPVRRYTELIAVVSKDYRRSGGLAVVILLDIKRIPVTRLREQGRYPICNHSIIIILYR